jgi:aminoglycoside 6'-N-acetyltransferase I
LPSHFHITELQSEDNDAVKQIAAMLASTFPHWLATLEEAREEVRDSFEPGRISLVARSGNEVLGWVGGIPEYDYAWELHPLVVREDLRGQGIGRALVVELENRVREQGALTLYLGADDDRSVRGTSAGGVDLFPDPLQHAARLEVIDHPVAFYRRVGFVVVGLIPDANGPGKPDILMAKPVGLAAQPPP